MVAISKNEYNASLHLVHTIFTWFLCGSTARKSRRQWNRRSLLTLCLSTKWLANTFQFHHQTPVSQSTLKSFETDTMHRDRDE